MVSLTVSGLCQTPPPADPEKSPFELFLFAVTAFKGSPREAIGVTEPEAQAITEVAAEWATKGRAFLDAERLLRREALYQSIEAEEYPAKVVEKRARELAQRVSNLQAERARTLQQQVEKLKVSFGSDRFQMLEAFVQAKAPYSFFPSPGGPLQVGKTTRK